MYEFCFTINGVRHCFQIPRIIEVPHRPPPQNFPELEIAISVLEIVQLAKPSEFTKQLATVSNAFIKQIQSGLPKGVELVPMKA
jgi:hypothetical protein